MADPEHAEGERLDCSAQAHLDIALTDTRLNRGLVPVTGLLEYTDALALEAQIKAGAHALLTEHPELDLDTRRAMAAGQLGGDTAAPREVVIYAHHQPTEAHGIVGVEGGHVPYATIDQLVEWCTTRGTRVSIRPVLDLSEEITTDAYAPTQRQREQAILLTPTCVFPHCSKDARGCDLDHITPYASGGKTTSWNLAPLCRTTASRPSAPGPTTAPAAPASSGPAPRAGSTPSTSPTSPPNTDDEPTDPAPRRHRRRGHCHACR
ncbi:hypothetical protein ASC77_14740 [Nocardioides sp. Root1257]|nr:hypothetical protein ASC77_14740 [Nocardioides sp. Root1257]